MQNQQSLQSLDSIENSTDQDLTQDIFYKKFQSYTRSKISDQVDQTITKYTYNQNFIPQTITYTLLFLLSLVLLILYCFEKTKKIQIKLLITQQCFDNQNTCTIPFTVKNNINYKIRLSQYKNSKDYTKYSLDVRLRTLQQLQGKLLNSQQANACGIYKTNQQMNVTYSKNGTLLNPQDIANPCGIIAKLYPYDKYTILKENQQIIEIEEYKFPYAYSKINYPLNSQSTQWLDIMNSHYAAWATFNFDYILYGTINNLTSGKYYLKIQRNEQSFRTDDLQIMLQSYWIFEDFNYYILIVVILTFLGTLTGEGYVLKRKFEQLRNKQQ